MKKNVVVIGGGTGTFVVLSGLKNHDVALSAIVSMMDSGGSTGRLRDQLGVLPPGDVRQCLVALSDATELWRKLFLYRFESGDLHGHNFGNIFLTALEKNTENYQQVIDTAAYILKTRGAVIPVTFDKVNLCVTYADGETIESEDLIDTAAHKTSRITRAFLKPSATANKRALLAILEADYIIIGPGDLYTSLIPNLIVQDVGNALKKSKGKLIMTMNLMTKKGQTTNYSARDHVEDLEHYVGRKMDEILINNADIPPALLAHYEREQGSAVKDDLSKDPHIHRHDLLYAGIVENHSSDEVIRSVLRHDAEKLAKALLNIIQS